jgi:SNF2 family DNA or RNA helicase
VASEKADQLGATVNLIICQKSKIDDWVDHFRTYYSYIPEFVYDLTDAKQLKSFLNHTTHADDPDCEACYGIINYELFWRRKELFKLTDFTLICDESGLLTNDSAKRTKGIMKLNYKNLLLLSGSVCGGKYENLWSQIHLLGWNISKEMYYNHYIDYHWDDSQGFPLRVIDGYKNVDRLKRKLRDKGCVFMKTEDCINLPDQIDQTIRVPVSNEYQIFKKDRICTINDTELIGDTVLTKLLYERQLCGQYNQDKFKAFQDLVESTSDRLIVFYNFNAELEALKCICEALGRSISLVNGQGRDLLGYENINDSITLIQYQAGATGLNLQKANRMIFFTPTLSAEDYLQARKRIHRLGQSKTCFYYQMICQGSIEERIYKTLAMRKDYTDELFKKEEDYE